MPERDANQLAADMLHDEIGGCTYHGMRWYFECEECAARKASHAALDELVALVGTLQQERDYLRDRGDKNARRAQAAEARAEALQQERDEARVDFDIAHQEYVEEATAHGATRERAEAAEAARDITLIPDGEGEAVT